VQLNLVTVICVYFVFVYKMFSGVPQENVSCLWFKMCGAFITTDLLGLCLFCSIVIFLRLCVQYFSFHAPNI